MKGLKRLKKILIVIMALLPLYAAGIYMFKTLDARNGLNSSQINCILKDSRGFVWLGTPAYDIRKAILFINKKDSFFL